jgi:hypothetical protein
MKVKLSVWPLPGEICLCVINDGVLQLGKLEYEAPLKPGKYIATSFGSDSLLLTECTSESSQLLSEVSRGICLSGGPFHIQAHILRLSRIHKQNRNGKKAPKLPSLPPEQQQAHRGSPPLRNGGKGCSLSPASSLTTGRNKPSACTGNRSNNTHNVFRKLAHSWVQSITKPGQNTGRAQ